MKFIKRIISAVLVLTLLLTVLASCNVKRATKITILDGDSMIVEVGDTVKLSASADGTLFGKVSWTASNLNINIDDRTGELTAFVEGKTIVTITAGDLTDDIVIIVVEDKNNIPNDEETPDTPGGELPDPDIYPEPTPDPDDNVDIPDDKYENMTSSEFYSSYTPAINLEDALLRSAKGFMSGSLETFDGSIDFADNMPMVNGKYVRNTAYYFSADGLTYNVIDASGNTVLRIFKGGGYISLEEVAAYLFAFGDIPANYDPDKDNKYVSSGNRAEWGRYVRLNNTQFKGGYSNEPDMPNITGAGGTFTYREIDIGGPSYNNGTKINRGSYRMVYAHSENGRRLDISERYVFFTQNHYSDFREYLNYYGGWGAIFGYETGGGRVTQRPEVYESPITTVAKIASLTVFIPAPTSKVYC